MRDHSEPEMIATTDLTDPLLGLEMASTIYLPKRIDILNEINHGKKKFGFYTNKLLPGILLEVGKSLVLKWEKLGIPIMKFDTITRAMRTLVMEKSPKDLDDVFDIAKCRHYHKKSVGEIGKDTLIYFL